MNNSFKKGVKDGIPIGLGYLSVSFTFGMAAVQNGLSPLMAAAISMLNLTSAGQFAGLDLIIAGGSAFEMALTQLIINLRYSLMSLSLSQKLDKSVTLADRFVIAFGNTDEIFAVSSAQKGKIGRRYSFGLMVLPYIGWAAGTLMGALASEVLPQSISSALGLAIYAMFIAIVVPPAKKEKSILLCIATAATLSLMLRFIPVFSEISGGFAIIICAIISSAVMAVVFPVKEEE